METSLSHRSPGVRAADAPGLAACFEHDGPFVTVVLRLETAIENAAPHNERVWRAHREALAAAGADDATLAAVDAVLPDAHHEGARLGLVAAGGEVVHVGHAADPPLADVARLGPLPVVAPLVAGRAAEVPVVVVLMDKAGADVLVSRRGDGAEPRALRTGTTDASDPHLRRTQPGGWSQRRFQQRAENAWHAHAQEVATVVDELVAEVAPAFVAVGAADDRWHQLGELVGADARPRLVRIATTRAPDGQDDPWPEVQRLVREHVDDGVRAVAARIADGDDRGLVVSGVEATVAALAEARVDTLYVEWGPGRDGGELWFGARPELVATDADSIRAMGGEPLGPAPVVDVLLRAALGTGAAVVVRERGARDDPDAPPVPSVADGVGARLRHAYA